MDTLTMTIPEVARALGISKNLAYELAKQDKLPVRVLRIGDKRLMVSRHAMTVLLTGNHDEKGG
jgi:predicted DNA-binding transcriptional regulator AlpA